MPASAVIFSCDKCEKCFFHKESLNSHLKFHDGRTKCTLCQRVCATLQGLRHHLMLVHKMSAQQMREIVPTRARLRYN